MASKSKVFDDSKPAARAPPSYDTAISADSIQCRQPSVFSFLRTNQKSHQAESRVRGIISGPDFTIASATPSVNACAAVLPAAEFSDLLQISRRLACMATSNQALFAQLNLGCVINPDVEPLELARQATTQTHLSRTYVDPKERLGVIDSNQDSVAQ
ncbi:hypothetical protein DFH29DRAFT_1000726 [Suillus ampliporus]|nr:hypothetical protein DFH29DRAFT_1000726 [Suillus ampliporus]